MYEAVSHAYPVVPIVCLSMLPCIFLISARLLAALPCVHMMSSQNNGIDSRGNRLDICMLP